jgi:dehydrogenase/reductase SDR family protein 1
MLRLLLLPLAASASRVAVVTGGTRGIGRGIAIELGRSGMTVYTLGRSSRATTPPLDQRAVANGMDLSVESAAEAVSAAGGRGIPLPCDISKEDEVAEAFDSVARTEGRLDLLVCSAFSTPPGRLRDDFWTQGMEMWDAVNGVGLRSVYACCLNAAPRMIDTASASSPLGQPPPLIVLVSSFGGKSFTFNVPYGVGKCAIDRLASDMAAQLKRHGVACLSLYPGLVQTEANLQMEVDGTWAEASGGLDLSTGETPALSGKAVAALAGLDAAVLMRRSGGVEVVAELAKDLGFTDEDGSTPPSIRSLKYLAPNFIFPQIEQQSGKPLPKWLKSNVPDVLLPWSVFSSGPPPEVEHMKPPA